MVTQHFWPESFRVNDLAEGFVRDGFEVDVLCGLPNYPKGEWFSGYRYTGPRRQEYRGVQVFRAGEVRRKGNTGARIFLNYVSWPILALFSLPRLPGSYDAVFCYNTSPVLMNLPAIVYAKLHRVPLTSYVLDLWPENLYSVLPVGSRFWRAVAERVSNWHYRRADRLIAMSESLRARLVERTGKTPEQVAVIPQYCEDFYAQPALDPEAAARFAGRFNLVFAGNFSPAQSLETVIAAAVQARAAGAENLHLLLVGDGMSRDALEALTDRLNARDTVTFFGSVAPTAIPGIFGMADGLIASLSDSPDLGLTVPAKIASCMAAGKPLLASMDGEGRAAVLQARNLASPACDVQGLADNMLRLFGMDEAGRRALGRDAFAYYQSHYRRRELLRQLEDFIL